MFKTVKYCPAFPEEFGSLPDARGFMATFVEYYNHHHRHSGIGLHTPASVHDGTAADIRAARQRVLDETHAAHPERFHRRPQAPGLPERVTINDPANHGGTRRNMNSTK